MGRVSYKSRAKRRLQMRRWRKNNPGKVRAANKKRILRLRNDPAYREKQRIYRHNYYWENRDKFLAKQRRYEKEHPGQRLQSQCSWCAANPLGHRAFSRLRQAIEYGLIPAHPGLVFYHPDYSRVLYGCWVTWSDALNIRLGMTPCPPCIDYQPMIHAARRHKKRMKERQRLIHEFVNSPAVPIALLIFHITGDRFLDLPRVDGVRLIRQHIEKLRARASA